MRKLMLVAAVLSVLAWSLPLAVVSNTAIQLNPVQMAGDTGPNGG